MNDYTYDVVCHSQGPWKLHKYLKKLGDKYIYRKGEYDKPKKEVTKPKNEDDGTIESKLDKRYFRAKPKREVIREEKKEEPKKPISTESGEEKKEKKTKEKTGSTAKSQTQKKSLKVKKLKSESKQEQIQKLYKLARQANTMSDKKDRAMIISRIRNSANRLGLDPEQFIKKQLK